MAKAKAQDLGPGQARLMRTSMKQAFEDAQSRARTGGRNPLQKGRQSDRRQVCVGHPAISYGKHRLGQVPACLSHRLKPPCDPRAYKKHGAFSAHSAVSCAFTMAFTSHESKAGHEAREEKNPLNQKWVVHAARCGANEASDISILLARDQHFHARQQKN